MLSTMTCIVLISIETIPLNKNILWFLSVKPGSYYYLKTKRRWLIRSPLISLLIFPLLSETSMLLPQSNLFNNSHISSMYIPLQTFETIDLTPLLNHKMYNTIILLVTTIKIDTIPVKIIIIVNQHNLQNITMPLLLQKPSLTRPAKISTASL